MYIRVVVVIDGLFSIFLLCKEDGGKFLCRKDADELDLRSLQKSLFAGLQNDELMVRKSISDSFFFASFFFPLGRRTLYSSSVKGELVILTL